MRRFPLPLVLLLLSAPAVAQGGVVPPWMANAPGSGTTGYPFGLSTACRVQYLYDQNTTGMVVPNVFSSFAVRAEQAAVNAAKSAIDLQIEMSATPTTHATMSATFASNRGPNHTVVFARRLVSMPATTAAAVGAWAPPFVLDAPFVYDPTNGDSLLVEFDVAAQPAGGWQIDTAWSGAGVHLGVGTGCNRLLASSSGGKLGGPLTYNLTGATANAPGVVALGFFELPVPFPIPGNPTCSLYHSLEVTQSMTTSTGGTSTLTLLVPTSTGLKGSSLFGSFAVLNGAAAIDSSPARRVFITGDDDCGRIYNLASNTALTGSTQALVAPVLDIR